MATYVDAFKGYIADVPRVWFKRCDGKVFYFDEISQASANPQTNFTEINGGWSIYPVAYIPGQSTMEISMTSAQFNADMFAMANGNQTAFAADAQYKTFTTERGLPDATTHKITLKHTPVADSVAVRGFEKDTTAGAGKFAVDGDTVEFDATETGEIEVVYEYVVDGANVIEVTNQESAIGEAIFKWPVYGGAEDCSD